MSSQSLNYNLLDAKVKSLTSVGPVTASSIAASGAVNFSATQSGQFSYPIAGAGTAITIPCVGVSATSAILASLGSANASATLVSSVVAGVNQFVVNVNAAPTVNPLLINWLVVDY